MGCTLDGVALDPIDNERFALDGDLDSFNFPESEPSDAMLIPMSGAQRKITIKGTYVSNNIITLRTFANYLDTWAIESSKWSASEYTYHSELKITNYTVRIKSCNYDWSSGEPNSINWELQLWQGSA